MSLVNPVDGCYGLIVYDSYGEGDLTQYSLDKQELIDWVNKPEFDHQRGIGLSYCAIVQLSVNENPDLDEGEWVETEVWREVPIFPWEDEDGNPKPPKACQCEGAGYLLTTKGSKITCPECGGVGSEDDDPQCVCGVYRSEHSMMGCPEGFQTKGSWAVEKEFIASLDDEMYEAIYHPYG